MWSYMANIALNNGIANPQAASCFLRFNVITVDTSLFTDQWLH